MPSGSHRGSRGSHSSGGSRSGGSSFGGRSSGGRSYGGYHGGHGGHFSGGFHLRTRRFRFGHSYVVLTSGKQAGLFLVGFLLFFFGVLLFATVSTKKENEYDLQLIKEDYNYYQDMIDYAQEHEDEGYIVDAIVTGKFYNPDAQRYYFDYVIDLPGTSNDLEGYTYSCYTLAQSNIYRIGDVIKVAVDSVPVTINTDSINMDYKDMPLERDGEYEAVRKTIRSNNAWIWVVSFIEVALVAIFVLLIIKGNTKEKVSETKTVTEKTIRKCAYCGREYSENSKKCPGCGASSYK